MRDYYQSEPGRAFEVGDHVISHPWWTRPCIIEKIDGRVATLLIDKPHDHFRDTVFSQLYELQLVRDHETERAQRHIESAQWSIKDTKATIKAYEKRLAKQQAELAEYRSDLRAAKKLPIKGENNEA